MIRNRIGNTQKMKLVDAYKRKGVNRNSQADRYNYGFSDDGSSSSKKSNKIQINISKKNKEIYGLEKMLVKSIKDEIATDIARGI